MNYWIIALPPADMNHCIKIGVFGLKRRNVINHVKEGDKVACYTTGAIQIIAFGTCTSDYYNDDSKIFKTDGYFIDRFDFEAKKLATPLNFTDYVDKMGFIKNLAYWSVHFRNGIVKIDKEDWQILETAAFKP